MPEPQGQGEQASREEFSQLLAAIAGDVNDNSEEDILNSLSELNERTSDMISEQVEGTTEVVAGIDRLNDSTSTLTDAQENSNEGIHNALSDLNQRTSEMVDAQVEGTTKVVAGLDKLNDTTSQLIGESTGDKGTTEVVAGLDKLNNTTSQLVGESSGDIGKEETEEEARQQKENAETIVDGIVDGLGEKLEGFSAALTTPSEGVISKFFGNIVEIGAGALIAAAATFGSSGALIPIFKGLFGKGSVIGKFLTNTFGAGGRIASLFKTGGALEGISKLFGKGGRFAKIGNLFKGVGSIFSRIGQFFGKSGPIASFLGKFSRLFRFLRAIPIIGQIITVIDGIRGFIKGFFEGEGSFFGKLMNGIRGAFAQILEGFSFGLLKFEDIMAFFDRVQEKISNFFASIFIFFDNTILPFFTETIPNFFTVTIPEFFASATAKISNFFSDTLPSFFTSARLNFKRFMLVKFGGFFGVTLPAFLKSAVVKVKHFFTDTIPNTFLNLADRVKIMVINVGAMLLDATASIIESINDIIPGERFDIGGAEAFRNSAAASRAVSAGFEEDIERRNYLSDQKLQFELDKVNQEANDRMMKLEQEIRLTENAIEDFRADRARSTEANVGVVSNTTSNTTNVTTPPITAENPDFLAAQMAGGGSGIRGLALE